VKGAINRIGFKGMSASFAEDTLKIIKKVVKRATNLKILELFEEDFYHEMIAVARIAEGFYEHLGECRFLAGKVLTNVAEKLPMNEKGLTLRPRSQKNHLFSSLSSPIHWIVDA
jgi:hypothetical protein